MAGIAPGGPRSPVAGPSRARSRPRRSGSHGGPPTGSADGRRRRRPVAPARDERDGSGRAVGRAAPRRNGARGREAEKLSKEAYRRQRTALDAELTRLGLRKNHLELAMGDPAVAANFVELRRVTSELADIDVALAAAEDAWLELEERAP